MDKVDETIHILAGHSCKNCDFGGLGSSCSLRENYSTIVVMNENGVEEISSIPDYKLYPKSMICENWEEERSLADLLEGVKWTR